MLHEAMADKSCQVLAYLAKLKRENPKSQSHIIGAGCENLGTRSRSFSKLKIS